MEIQNNYLNIDVEEYNQYNAATSLNTIKDDMYKHIEKCARTCYKSEDKICEGSAEKMVNRLKKAEHGAMLEHGTIYLKLNMGDENTEDPLYQEKYDLYMWFKDNPYSRVTTNNELVYYFTEAYITTNYRVIFENNLEEAIKPYICLPTEHHIKRRTFKFITNIGCTHEMNRHRTHSIGEESTRYCNYTKDKFHTGENAGLNIILPTWGEKYPYEQPYIESFEEKCQQIVSGEYEDNFFWLDYWLFAMEASAFSYYGLVEKCHIKPEFARDVLTLATKSEIVHTAFEDDWKFYVDLRYNGTTGAPHDTIKKLTEKMLKLL